MIQGKNWGRLEEVHCRIEENGKVFQESSTDDRGIAKFEFTNSGKLIIEHKGWQSAEINLSELTVRSVAITLEREKFRENMSNYEFEINGEILKGINKIKHWELKKKIL